MPILPQLWVLAYSAVGGLALDAAGAALPAGYLAILAMSTTCVAGGGASATGLS